MPLLMQANAVGWCLLHAHSGGGFPKSARPKMAGLEAADCIQTTSRRGPSRDAEGVYLLARRAGDGCEARSRASCSELICCCGVVGIVVAHVSALCPRPDASDTFFDPHADRHGNAFLGTLSPDVSHKG